MRPETPLWLAWHAAWLPWLVVQDGLYNWIGIMYVGIATMRLRWVAAGFVYAIPTMCNMALDGPHPLPHWLWLLSVASLMGALVHAGLLLNEYWQRVAYLEKWRPRSPHWALAGMVFVAPFGIYYGYFEHFSWDLLALTIASCAWAIANPLRLRKAA